MAKDKTTKDTKTKKVSNMAGFSKIESFMVPPQFRKRSTIVQRLYFIIVTLVYAFSLGLFVYYILGDFKQTFNIKDTGQVMVFLITALMVIGTLFMLFFFMFWNRSRGFVISVMEFIGFLLPPIIFIGGMLYFSSSAGSKDFYELIEMTGYVSAGMGAVTVVYTLIRNLLKIKTYRFAWRRTAFTMIGVLISSAAPLIYDKVLLDKTTKPKVEMPLYITMAIYAAGIIILMFAVALTMKYNVVTERNIWSAIRYTSGTPALVIYALLFAIGFQPALKGELITWVIIDFLALASVLVGFIVYLFMKGRIKNIWKTNPLFNELALKIFIAIELIISFVFIYLLPSSVDLPSYGNTSYMIMALGALMMIIGVVTSHFMNLITYNKRWKLNIAAILGTFIVIIVIAISIVIMDHSELISEILGRELTLMFVIVALITQLTILATNLIHVITTISKKDKTKKDLNKVKKLDRKKKG